MFTHTIDSKLSYTDKDGNIVIDISKSIFNVQGENNTIFTVYRLPKDMEMRPDKVSYATYGTDDYTEMILKFMVQPNPFAIETDDIVVVPTLESMFNDVIDIIPPLEENENYDFVKNYHKYIDDTKLPGLTGSESSSKSASKTSSIKNNIMGSSNEPTASGQGSEDIVSTNNSQQNKSARAALSNDLYKVFGSGSDDVNTSTNDIPSGVLSDSTIDYSGSSLISGSTINGGSSSYVNESSDLGYGIDDDELLLGVTDMNEKNDESKIDLEPNLANDGESGIKFVNGRIYFGNNVYSNPNDITDIQGTNKVDSNLVDCARNGVTLSQFLDATIKNEVKRGK